jgi:flagellar assembly factor FliW
MKIETVRFGEVDVPDERVIQFVEPILGFEDSESYILLDHAPDSPFHWLQSVQDPDLAFVVTHPKLFNLPYDITLTDEVGDKLALTNPDDVLILNIVNIPADDPAGMTANLLGPIVINQNSGRAMQVVLNDNTYSTKVRLIPDTSTQTQEEENETESASTVVAFPKTTPERGE